MHVLFTLLGRSPRAEGGYRKTRYTYPDGTRSTPTTVLGWDLIGRIHPSHVIVMGTAGSMWDFLLDSVPNARSDEGPWLNLIEATERKQVEPAHLSAIEPALSQALETQIRLALIPYGRNEEEQLSILDVMAKHVPRKASISLDVSHGFRHLPMLVLFGALYLEAVKEAAIRHVYYGFYDPDTQEAPVFDLAGLLRLARWTQALAAFDADGDYGRFATLLEADGLPADKIGVLRKAAHAEKVFNHELASQSLRLFLPVLGQDLSGVARLFAPALAERFAWARNTDPASRLAALARERLSREDWNRATALAVTAYLAGIAEPGERIGDYETLEAIEDECRKGERGDEALRADYERLKKIRNALAHGSVPKDEEIRRIVNGPERLAKTLHALFEKLLSQ